MLAVNVGKPSTGAQADIARAYPQPAFREDDRIVFHCALGEAHRHKLGAKGHGGPYDCLPSAGYAVPGSERKPGLGPQFSTQTPLDARPTINPPESTPFASLTRKPRHLSRVWPKPA